MAQKQGSSKKSRDKKCRPRGSTKTTGNRGAKRNKQTPLALALMGKGKYATRKPVDGPPRLDFGNVMPWDPEQSRINKELGYW